MLNSVKVIIVVSAMLMACELNAQIKTPRASPSASISQTIGISNVTINYSRPAVNGRKIFGELVPFGQVWRTGANESTTITFSDNAKIEGKDIPAGTYGIFTFPEKDEWIIVFSKDSKLWGNNNYNSENDFMRINAKTQSNTFTERLTFNFDEITNNSSVISIAWENVKVSFKVEFDTPNMVVKQFNNSFNWSVANQAAQYYLMNNLDVTEGLKWAQRSLSLDENYLNLRIMAQLLFKSNEKENAIAMLEKAIDLEVNNKSGNLAFDLENMKSLLSEWKK
jgi:hypothetical protein